MRVLILTYVDMRGIKTGAVGGCSIRTGRINSENSINSYETPHTRPGLKLFKTFQFQVRGI